MGKNEDLFEGIFDFDEDEEDLTEKDEIFSDEED